MSTWFCVLDPNIVVTGWLCSELAIKRMSDQISHRQTFSDGSVSDYCSILNRAIQLRKTQRVVGLIVIDDAIGKVTKKLKCKAN